MRRMEIPNAADVPGGTTPTDLELCREFAKPLDPDGVEGEWWCIDDPSPAPGMERRSIGTTAMMAKRLRELEAGPDGWRVVKDSDDGRL